MWKLNNSDISYLFNRGLPSFILVSCLLNPFQEKRSILPRFYFIGDDDLLEILGQSQNPAVIQSHLKKLFAGIHSVDFDEGCKHITAMKSLEGEVVPLLKAVEITPEVEVSSREIFPAQVPLKLYFSLDTFLFI